MVTLTQTLAHQAQTSRMAYFNSVRDVKEFDSVWDITEIDDLDLLIPFNNSVGRRVCYQYIPEDTTWEQLNDPESNPMVEISTHLAGDTWMHLWEAAERLIKQADTHHRYIEDFEMRDDGSLELVTGS